MFYPIISVQQSSHWSFLLLLAGNLDLIASAFLYLLLINAFYISRSEKRVTFFLIFPLPSASNLNTLTSTGKSKMLAKSFSSSMKIHRSSSSMVISWCQVKANTTSPSLLSMNLCHCHSQEVKTTSLHEDDKTSPNSRVKMKIMVVFY